MTYTSRNWNSKIKSALFYRKMGFYSTLRPHFLWNICEPFRLILIRS